MSHVFVLDSEQRPLDPVASGVGAPVIDAATSGRVAKIPLYDHVCGNARPEVPTHPLRLKIDPGSKTTGLALVNDASGAVVWAAELTHRGQQVKKHLTDRRAVRGAVGSARPLPPSALAESTPQAGLAAAFLESRIANVLTWVARLRRLCPIGACRKNWSSLTHNCWSIQRSAVSSINKGRWQATKCASICSKSGGRRCAYCNKTGVPLQIEHLTPRARGGSNRVSNLTLACEPCNSGKAPRLPQSLAIPDLQAQAKQPLNDAAAVNATRWALYERLKATGLPVETGTGGRTKWNRVAAEPAQDALAGCGLRGGQYPSGVAGSGGTLPFHHGDRMAVSPDVPDD